MNKINGITIVTIKQAMACWQRQQFFIFSLLGLVTLSI